MCWSQNSTEALAKERSSEPAGERGSGWGQRPEAEAGERPLPAALAAASTAGEANASPRWVEPDRGGLSRIEWDGDVRFSGKTAGEMGHRIGFESHPPHQENRSYLRKRVGEADCVRQLPQIGEANARLCGPADFPAPL